MGFEECLIKNAAPVFADIKVANLFNYAFKNLKDCERVLCAFNTKMNIKGVYAELLQHKEAFYLIYIYRKSSLLRELNRGDIEEFLGEIGYKKSNDVLEAIEQLKRRIMLSGEFPHEIGLFLGYPLADVKSFIEKKGRDCVLCGEWKVYHDEQMAQFMFCKLKLCRQRYMELFMRGISLYEMTVSA